MEESILTSIKKLVGIPEEYTNFDMDLIIHINSALSVLNDLGVGPSEGFSISDKTATWSDFVPNHKRIETIKSYVYLKVRMLFDPPTSSSVMEAMTRSINEFEWRINVAVDPEDKTEEVNVNG